MGDVRKRFIPVYSVLAVAIVLLAVSVPGCGGPTTGTMVVQATICGVPWQGAVNYTLTRGTGSLISGTSSPATHSAVPTTHSGVVPATWTCAYVSGGPVGAFLNSVKPSTSQTLVAGATVTFTMDFELDQDAGIQWLAWTRNGESVGQPGQEYYEIDYAVPCETIDAHFIQRVDGCEGYNVTINETSWLTIQELEGPLLPTTIVVVDDWCAVNKTPAPREKVSQWSSVNGTPAEKGFNSTIDPGGSPATLDVHTVWQLLKSVNYTKNVDWLGISSAWMFEENGPHQCVLFELVLPAPGDYLFQLQTSAEVTLVDDADVNPSNNRTQSAPLFLTVRVWGGP
jgi:hypothetical protein